MTRQEFYQHTGVMPEYSEYWAINEVYNRSDLDKASFCKAWCRMNRERVKEAKAKAKADKERMKEVTKTMFAKKLW